MRVVWIEDHQLIGDSLELLLQVVMPELTLDKARDLHSAQQLVRTFPYKLVLLDWWLGDVDGATSIAALREAGCEAPIVVVSGDEREPVLRSAQALGVAGYVRKSAEPQELIETLRTVLQGGHTPPPKATTRASLPSDLQAHYPELTARQIDVFREMIRGSSDKQIARELGIGDTTVKSHVRSILALLGVRSRGEAAYRARSDGAV
ncbi:DNA-binding NarL/FixJ family response regulator [Inhella inkyongensis]|uniref:DNA-binding NarL/FixJ family response regulator n=1 Tax=Inhella inkyongensis TaxID=392593 RepID=A0A840S3I3_9BURK|nr:response regulator transcription factor [Inhella inkyongensis]MBB5205797.1 DNA-binding NarL/FixJ family response regulator [Inhella inkyongensis]